MSNATLDSAAVADLGNYMSKADSRNRGRVLTWINVLIFAAAMTVDLVFRYSGIHAAAVALHPLWHAVVGAILLAQFSVPILSATGVLLKGFHPRARLVNGFILIAWLLWFGVHILNPARL